MNIRVMTFNIQHGYDYVQKKMNLPLMAEVMNSLEVDIICVNEVRGEGAYPDEPKILSELTNKNSVFGVALTDSRGDYGNLLLSRFPVISSEIIKIPMPEVKTGELLYEPRSIIKAVVGTSPEITVIATHFGLNNDEQTASVKAACEIIDNCKTPCIMMGDFNSERNNPVLAPLLERLNDASEHYCPDRLSFTSTDPKVKIDYVLVSRDIKVNFADIPSIIASDHRPHYADLEI